MSSTENLHVPQAKTNSMLTSQSVKSIMDAYNTQSKIRLYEDDSAQSQGAGNENIGVTGKNIPLSMLRPSSNPVQEVDENGNAIVRKPSRGRILQEVESYGDIAKAYMKMNGMDEEDAVEADEDDGWNGGRRASELFNRQPSRDLSSIRRFEAEYVEDMPDTDEGLLEILELAIKNARANLEMLESLYAALSPSDSDSQEG